MASDTKDRNVGIEALRAFAMFQIVVIHTLKQGGIFAACDSNFYMIRISWLLECWFICCVDVYALISGYVGVNSKFKISRFVMLWLQVAFYTVIITLVYSIFFPEVISYKSWINAFLPIITGQYWYVSAYFLLLFFIPLINAGIRNISEKNFRLITIGLLLFTSVYSTLVKFYPLNISGIDAFGVSDGFSTLWLLTLYILGAYIRKTEKLQSINFAVLWAVLLACVFLTWTSIFMIPAWSVKRFGEMRYQAFLFNHASPTVLLTAVAQLLLFLKIKANSKVVSSIFVKLGKASLAVYLIHTNPLIWNGLIDGYAVGFTYGSVIMMLVKVLGASFAIYSICTIIELLRIELFKILGINKFVSKIFDGKLESQG